jgi:hypothetical protein
MSQNATEIVSGVADRVRSEMFRRLGRLAKSARRCRHEDARDELALGRGTPFERNLPASAPRPVPFQSTPPDWLETETPAPARRDV